ncbi:hypothetical protein ACFQI7_37640 [Paenibacillus allorhizosphaerae]|uniref:Uncharacterized protein n=1 Tax=Paenibacillus allorhizosphaerae TaxID=2849866 RepID=A0ABM8VV60_9BACL|nr:hypothetical protein [Paenibacillus allorhizosphaerae]CAG7659241.1 hypothetical protein PAECIP111802_07502 [Paenibacillus allorhizosphaerae]
MLETLTALERFFIHLERRQAKEHVTNGIKEWLLASRAVIDSVIDTLEEEQGRQTARKIEISKD